MSDAAAAQDREDMGRLARGDEAALSSLIERHGGTLFAYLIRLLQNPADAEDLAQETFVRVYHHRGRYDPEHSFAAWLYAIAGNLVRDRYRWRTRHPETPLEPSPAESPAPSAVGWAAVVPDQRPTPAQAHLADERAQAVRDAIAELAPELREVLVLAEYENLSHAEIAEIVGGSIKAVESRLYRARQQLKSRLSRWLARG